MNIVNTKTIEINSNLEEVAIVGQSCRSLAQSLHLNETKVYEVELAVVEAVTNCIEHAYNLESGNSILIKFEVSENDLIISIQDYGCYWENFKDQINKESPFEFNPLDIDSLPEGGMGVALLFQLMDEVSYQREGNINTLKIKKKIARSELDTIN